PSFFSSYAHVDHSAVHPFPTRRSSDLAPELASRVPGRCECAGESRAPHHVERASEDGPVACTRLAAVLLPGFDRRSGGGGMYAPGAAALNRPIPRGARGD